MGSVSVGERDVFGLFTQAFSRRFVVTEIGCFSGSAMRDRRLVSQ